MKKYLVLFICILAGGFIFLIKQNKELKRENNRQSGNVETLMGDIKLYKVRDSLNVAENNALTLTVEEFKKYRADDAKLIKDLKMRPKDVEYITKTEIKTETVLEYRIDSVGCFRYKDKWLQVDACVGDSMIIQSRDSIAQIITPIYKRRFLWWKWKVTGIRQVVTNFNPNSTVSHSEIIRMKK